jgi:hypothetical protein
MTAMAAARRMPVEYWYHHRFPLAVGNKAWKNGIACIDKSTGLCEPGHAEADLFVIGHFDETVDATTQQKLVSVDLGREVIIRWCKNDDADPVLASHVGNDCYALDDQTVSISHASNARSRAGRIWAVDATDGVAVEFPK